MGTGKKGKDLVMVTIGRQEKGKQLWKGWGGGLTDVHRRDCGGDGCAQLQGKREQRK